MKTISWQLFLGYHVATAAAACPPETTIKIGTGFSKIKVSDFDVGSVRRFSSATPGSRIVFKSYETEPLVTMMSDGVIDISAGAPCDDKDDGGVDVTSSAFSVLGSMSPLIMAHAGFISPLAAVTTYLIMGSTFAQAQTGGTGPITIEIYTDVDALIHEDTGSMTCPPESFHFEHHPSVHGGYAGCVGEKYLLPCGQDAQGADDLALYGKTPINWNGEECVETGYTYEDRTFWILWGDPLDKNELLKRTGLNPTVKFPLERGPYPSYTHGTDETTSMYDDASSAKAYAKDFLVYLGAITENERDNWYVSMTEGAEQGIEILWAAKALEIAQTTCNRDIHVLMEAPAYAYNNNEIADWANARASTFYNSTECTCFPDCHDPTVTVINVGFFPPNIPTATGGDGLVYSATSASALSPWFESMVFPENPSGTIKIPQLPNANRPVCDRVYVLPMYFYYNDFKIPLEDRPECSGWAYATTKGYSASIRTGFITYKKAPDVWVDAVSSVMSIHGTLGYGSYSEWSWMGQMQIQKMMSSRALDDPTSWIGAYSGIMKEKWDVMTDAFANCPVLSLTNKGKGAYAWFLYKEPYLGLQDSFVSSFFLDVLGVSTTTYYWGFRGADPSEFYGNGVGTYDFSRMQLYRDLNVYKEVARRAKIVCSDLSANVGDYISINDWETKARLRKRGRRSLREDMTHLTERQLHILEKNDKIYDEYHQSSEECAPNYTTSCFYEKVGKRHSDVVHVHSELELA